MALPLYQSDWSPRGVKKTWDRCSMGVTSTRNYLGPWNARMGGELTEVVGWFDEAGAARIVVADFDNGKRLVMRHLRRSTKITIERRAA